MWIPVHEMRDTETCVSRFRPRRDLLLNGRGETVQSWVEGVLLRGRHEVSRPRAYMDDQYQLIEDLFQRLTLPMRAVSMDTHHKRLASAAPCLMINGIQ